MKWNTLLFKSEQQRVVIAKTSTYIVKTSMYTTMVLLCNKNFWVENAE